MRLLPLAALALAAPAAACDYYEQLMLQPLPLSALRASFNFRSNTTMADFAADNFQFFPRSLAQILQFSDTRELHLRFGLGRWDAENWGARPWAGTREGGTGVELWAWLDASSDAQADTKWRTLTNALSGLFCASLNFIDGTRTTRPVLSFATEGDHAVADRTHMQLLYGTLPREVVCTENLTPFLKLLPCKGKAGIASLLDGHKLFDASWQSMAIDVRPLCDADGTCVLQIEQTIDMVLDMERSKRPRDNPIPRPVPADQLQCDTSKSYQRDGTCFPAALDADHSWSLSQIFGRPVRGACPLADGTPPVCLAVPASHSVVASEGAAETRSEDGQTRCFAIPTEADFDLVLPDESEKEEQNGDNGKSVSLRYHENILTPEIPLLYAERSLTGHGAERGGVQTILTNPSTEAAVDFVYMESLPWFMRIYLHTLEARIVDPSSAAPASPAASSAAPLVQNIYYRPALDRARGTQLEVRMHIPPNATVSLTYDFEKSILRYTEYPPDANRGFDVAAAVITILSPDGDSFAASNLRTPTLLLSLPTPDFSMPYNVIIFTSTAIALAFGGMFNIIVRRFVAADEGPNVTIQSVLGKLGGRLRKAITAKGRKEASEAKSVSETEKTEK